MAEQRYVIARWGIPAALTLAIAGVVWREAAAARFRAPLPVLNQVPAFTLVSQTGEPITRETLRGQIWIADFIFSRCAGQCPMMTSQMSTVASEFPNEPSLTLVSFSVDPDWDTPEVFAAYAKRLGASAKRWHFVTGDAASIRRLCLTGFRLALGDSSGSMAEPITHSTRLVLVDRTGGVRGYYDATDPVRLQQLRRDVRQLLREQS